MKKAAILTLHYYDNFGSVLQAYALKTAVGHMPGWCADIVPFKPCLPEYQYFSDAGLLKKYDEKRERFKSFRAEYLGISEPFFSDAEKISRDYDAYIAGSDIIWSREHSGLERAYFLSFAPEGKKRIAYAASMILKKEDQHLLSKYESRFNALSVREKNGAELVLKLTGRKAETALDPALLLKKEDYAPIMEAPREIPDKPYLLSYFLTHDSAAADYTNMVAKKFGLKIVHFWADYPKRIFPDDAGCFTFCGPKEFLFYVKNAAMVLTNSYHGTVFSVIFGKPFYTYVVQRGDMQNRAASLMTLLDLKERQFSEFSSLKDMSIEWDYKRAHEILSNERERSIAFLHGSLEG